MDLKSPGTHGSYVDLIKDKLVFYGNKEMSSYFLRDIKFLDIEADEKNRFNKGSFVVWTPDLY